MQKNTLPMLSKASEMRGDNVFKPVRVYSGLWLVRWFHFTMAYQAIKQVSFFPAVKMIRPKRKKFAIFSSKPFSERTIIEIVLETLSFVSKKQFLSLFTVGFSLDIILWLNRFIVVQNWCQNHLGVLKWEGVNQTNGISLLEVIYPLKENT